jgi:hypothetical protein
MDRTKLLADLSDVDGALIAIARMPGFPNELRGNLQALVERGRGSLQKAIERLQTDDPKVNPETSKAAP